MHILTLALSATALLLPVVSIPTAQAPTSIPSNFWAFARPASIVAGAAASAKSPPPAAHVAASAKPAAPGPSAAAAPRAQPNPTAPAARVLTAADLEKISPATKGPCKSGQEHPAECRTATQAAPFIQKSFERYGISHPSVQAAVISTILYESGDFKYNTHLSSNNGQGTRDMMSKAFVAEYARSLGKSVDAVLADEEASFGSAAWYLTAKCPFSVRRGMWGGEESEYAGYVTQCLGTEMEDRAGVWERALGVLGKA